MEAADSATGDGNEQSGEDRRSESFATNTFIQFGQLRPLDEEHSHQRHSHKQHGDGKQRIDFTDNLVDRQHRGNDVVDEDDAAPDIDPQQVVAAHLA